MNFPKNCRKIEKREQELNSKYKDSLIRFLENPCESTRQWIEALNYNKVEGIISRSISSDPFKIMKAEKKVCSKFYCKQRIDLNSDWKLFPFMKSKSWYIKTLWEIKCILWGLNNVFRLVLCRSSLGHASAKHNRIDSYYKGVHSGQFNMPS